jgi:ElaB/YqjD/DUF883 family membrane-anchored ribosome-binding protein
MSKRATNANVEHETTTDDFLDHLRAVVRDAEELLEATEGHASERIAEIRARAEETLGSAKERLREAGEGVEARARSAARTTDSYVRENPWMAVAIAAGIGYLLGNLGRRR